MWINKPLAEAEFQSVPTGISGAVSEKLQTPSSKLQRSSKIQVPSAPWWKCPALGFGVWSFFGAWRLGFGVSLGRCARLDAQSEA